MAEIDHFRLLAGYNVWMNGKLYTAAATLSPDALALDRGAFFGSILRTLEHLVVADTIWLKRFAGLASAGPLAPIAALPKPAALDAVQFGALEPLRARRTLLDQVLSDWIATLGDDDLGVTVAYANSRGEAQAKPLGALLVHVFNHQTHHRGQTTTLLTQAGVDVGLTDLVALIPNA